MLLTNADARVAIPAMLLISAYPLIDGGGRVTVLSLFQLQTALRPKRLASEISAQGRRGPLDLPVCPSLQGDAGLREARAKVTARNVHQQQPRARERPGDLPSRTQ